MWEVGIYLCFYEELRSSNHFHSKRKLKWEKWRGGRALGLEPLDNEIQKAVNFGYAAHIPRLMVFLNVFVLLQVRPEDVIRWFMEVVSMDATIYFMWAIVTTMGAYNLRFMQKPYISTSAYLLKMTNYPKGDWCDTFTALFYDFLARNKSRLKGSCSVYLRNLAHFERQNHTEQARIKRLAQSFQKRVTSR
jgi:deoxyribodipyrimidine photolyase-related protein